MPGSSTRFRIFVGSSKEHVNLARAVQENLDPDFETKIWDQDVFRLSQYPLESLLDQLLTSDFGVFVLAPDDVARMRGKNHLVARDNVIFELGLFAGRLGRNRTFVITPRGVPELHLPTDLLGLTAGDYDPDRVDKNLTAAMGAVCNKTRRLVSERGSGIPVRSGLLRAELFTDFTDDFGPLIRDAKEITVYFIHSRRWRENHNDDVIYFLGKSKVRFQVFLPNLTNSTLMESIVSHFDDGPHIPGFIADAYRYFMGLKQAHLGKVEIRLFDAYPTYSFYRFDDKAIVAMYPTTPIRKSVPAFFVARDGIFGEFLAQDWNSLLHDCRLLTIDELRLITEQVNTAQVKGQTRQMENLEARATKRFPRTRQITPRR